MRWSTAVWPPVPERVVRREGRGQTPGGSCVGPTAQAVARGRGDAAGAGWALAPGRLTSGISRRAGSGSGESFAGILTPVVEVVDVHLHAAEKLHAMLRDYGDRENRRLVAAVVGQCVVDVFAERDDAQQLAALPLLPAQAQLRPSLDAVVSASQRRAKGCASKTQAPPPGTRYSHTR